MDRDIKIVIKDKVATAPTDAVIVCGNSDYTIHFQFDDEWEGIEAKTARFKYSAYAGPKQHIDVPFTGDAVEVPVLTNAHKVEVGVFAGDLTTTTGALIHCLPSIRCGSGEKVEPDPDKYDQLMELIKSGGLDGESAYEAAVAGGYEGTEEEFGEAMAKIANGEVVGAITIDIEETDGELTLVGYTGAQVLELCESGSPVRLRERAGTLFNYYNNIGAIANSIYFSRVTNNIVVIELRGDRLIRRTRNYVQEDRKINGKALDQDITLTAEDLGINNKKVLDVLTPEVMQAFDATVAASHTHANKELLDSLTPDKLGGGGGVKVKNFDNFAFFFVDGYGSDIIGCLDMVAFEQLGENAAIMDIGIITEDGVEYRTCEMQDSSHFGQSSQFNVYACPVFSLSMGAHPVVRFFEENIMDTPFYSTLINTEYASVNVYYLGGK